MDLKGGTLLAVWKKSICMFQCLKYKETVSGQQRRARRGHGVLSGLWKPFAPHSDDIFPDFIFSNMIFFPQDTARSEVLCFLQFLRTGWWGISSYCVRLNTGCFNGSQLLVREPRSAHPGVSKAAVVRCLRGNCVGGWLWRCIQIKCLESWRKLGHWWVEYQDNG